MTTTIAISKEDLRNPYKWAKENLSQARQRAFDEQMRKLSWTKCSPEYSAQYKVTEEAYKNHLRAHAIEIDEIEQTAYAKAAQIDRQIQELYNQKQQILETASNEATKIRVQGYSTDEYKAADKVLREIGERDTAIYTPKVEALMIKFLERQMASDASNN
jgi:hypothetical protein